MKIHETTESSKHARFSNRSIIAVVDRLSLCQEQASKLWYSKEDINLFKMSLSLDVHEVRSHLDGALLGEDEELVSINAAAILGLEKYLTHELSAEYKIRRNALQRAVLEEHRCHRALKVAHEHRSRRLAKVSLVHSQWARERARAAALFLEQDVNQDLKEMNMNLQAAAQEEAAAPCRSCSVLRRHGNAADATMEAEEQTGHPFERVWGSAWNSVRTNVQTRHR